MAIAQKGATLDLTFTLPIVAADGERLTKPLEVEIFRAVTEPGRKPPTTFLGLAAWSTFSAKQLVPYTQGKKTVFPYRLSDPEFAQSQGSTFSFAVCGLTHGFRNRPVQGELSNVVQATLLDVSGPVENLRSNTIENALQLSWTPPSHALSGHALSSLYVYRVYKSQTGEPATFELRGETAPAQFSDSEFNFGQKYFYKVRAVFQQSDRQAESEDSEVVEITPRDTFPPAPPANMNGLFSAGAAQLVWTANTEPDLSGYNVYRREKDTPAQKINSELLRTPTFVDRSVQPGREYFYRVTAVDAARNESAPSQEVAITTQ